MTLGCKLPSPVDKLGVNESSPALPQNAKSVTEEEEKYDDDDDDDG